MTEYRDGLVWEKFSKYPFITASHVVISVEEALGNRSIIGLVEAQFYGSTGTSNRSPLSWGTDLEDGEI